MCIRDRCKERLQSVTVAALEARLFDGKPLAGPCGRAKKEKAAAAHGLSLIHI